MAEGQPLQDPSKAPLQGEGFQHAEPPPPYQQQGQNLVNYSILGEQVTLSDTGVATHLSDPSWQQQPQPVPLATAPPPQQNVRVVVTAPVFGEKPVRLQCPNCHADIRTAVESRSGRPAMLISRCSGLGLFICQGKGVTKIVFNPASSFYFSSGPGAYITSFVCCIFG